VDTILNREYRDFFP